MDEWVVVELSYQGESLKDLSRIGEAVKEILGEETEVFVPIFWLKEDEYKERTCLFRGYIFVKNIGLKVEEFFDLEDHEFFKKILTVTNSDGLRNIEPVEDSVVEGLRKQLRESVNSGEQINADDLVYIRDGDYRRLIGRVLCVDQEKLVVGIDKKISYKFFVAKSVDDVELGEINMIVEVPRVCVNKIKV